MNLSVQDNGPWQHTLSVEIPAEEVEANLEQVARRVQSRVSLPGFRKGKAPLDLVRQNFADAVEQEFFDAYLPRIAGEAIAEAKLNPVVPPMVRNLKFTPGQPLSFEAIVDVAPEVEAKDYRGLPLTRRTRTIDETAIERVLGDLREESAVFVDLDRAAQSGDVVLLDSTRLDANGRRLASSRAKNARILLGAPGLLPDLENGLMGAEAGQERTLNVTYPADYGQAELAGKTVRYVVKVRKIQEKKLRDPDDNFAREVFRLESYEALRQRVRENLEAEEAARVRRELEVAVAEQLIRNNPFELPQRLVEYMLERVVREQTQGREVPAELQQQLDGHYRPGVERSLKREVLLGAVARQESLAVGDDEIAADIDRMAAADPRQASRVRARYQTADRRRALGEALLERKAMDWVIREAKVVDEPVTEPALATG